MCTFSPADDIIHVGGHSCPEVVVTWVAWLWLHVRLFVLLVLVEPPELPTAEQIGFAVVGPDESCVHSVHEHPVSCPHAPFGQGPRVTGQGLCVFENPIFGSLTDVGESDKQGL